MSSPLPDDDAPSPPPPRISKIPADVYVIPVSAATAGSILGFVRGSRMSALKFLAENAHRPPTTVRGWYFYNKTKNYRVLLGGFRGGAKEAAKLGAFGAVWVGFEQGWKWTVDRTLPHSRLLGAARDVVAGVGTACVVSAIYGLPRRMAMRTVGLGLGVGAMMGGMRQARDWLGKELEDAKDAEE